MGAIFEGALAWFLGIIVANSKTIIGQILVGLGISIVTGVTVKVALGAAVAQFQSVLPYYDLLNAVGIVDFVNILASAVTARAAIDGARVYMARI